MTTKRLLLVAALILVFTTAYAQRFGEAVQVTIIEVPVTVVDRSGNPVRGLTKADFELFDDGKKVPIDYFEVVDMTTVSKEDDEDEAAPPPAVATRNFLLLFDLANSSPGTIERASQAAREFVDTQIGERDQAAVAVFTNQAGAKMVTNFTRDRKLLANAIDTLGHPKYFKLSDPLMISGTVIYPDQAGGGSAPGSGAAGDAKASINAAIAEMVGEQDRVARVAADSEARNRLKIQLTNFGLVARSLDKLQGQKQIILLSEGFDAKIISGREDMSLEKTRAENDAVMSGEVWKVNQEDRFGSSTSVNEVRTMADLFNRSDVTLHAIDIKGLRVGVDASAGVKKSSNESLHLITKPTGGTVFQNANDMKDNFQRMLKRQEVIYVLGFTARTTGKPGKFRTLKVKSKAGEVSHRAGFYEPGAAVTDLEKTLSLAEMLMTDAPIDDVEVSLAATPLPGPGGKSRVPVLVEIPGNRLLEDVKGNAATANLFLYAFDENGAVSDFLQQRISLDLSKAGEAVRGAGVRYFGTLRLVPGNYAVKALVRVEETGRVGLHRSDITVPKFDSAVILPPVQFADPANWVMLVGPSRGDDYAYPFTTGTDRFIPKRTATLTQTSDAKFALFLYRVPLENLQVTPEIVSNGSARQTDKVKLLGRTSADDRGGVKLLFSFRPEDVPVGEHELRFTVKAKDGTESIVAIPFRVM